MRSTDIERYLKESVTSFRDAVVIGPGTAYHYTVHAQAIIESGKLLGAPLNTNLDQTQDPNGPHVARCDPGVVFAYSELAFAAEVGDAARLAYPGCCPEVIEVQYSSAVKAIHSQEAALDAPPTILISSAEIFSYRRLRPCSDFYDENAT